LTSDFEKINKKVLEDSEVHDAEMKEKIKLRNERVQQKIAERELIEAATKNDTTVDNGDNRIETEEQQETKLTSSPEVLKEIHGDFKETERKKSKKKSKKNKVKPTISELPPLKHAPTIILSPLHGVNKAFVNDESIDDNSSVLEDQTTPKLLEQSTI